VIEVLELTRVCQYLVDRLNQPEPIRGQLANASPHHFLEQPLAAREQRHHGQTPVLPVTAPADIAVLLQPVNQFRSTVMFQGNA
jgi:hypothetical protein